eukprot:5159576-Karenia_brevis.AAC.1
MDGGSTSMFFSHIHMYVHTHFLVARNHNIFGMLSQKIFALLEADDVDAAVDNLCGHVWELSMQRSGCWAVQSTMMAGSGNQRIVLMNELRGHVLVASKSPHGSSCYKKPYDYCY